MSTGSLGCRTNQGEGSFWDGDQRASPRAGPKVRPEDRAPAHGLQGLRRQEARGHGRSRKGRDSESGLGGINALAGGTGPTCLFFRTGRTGPGQECATRDPRNLGSERSGAEEAEAAHFGMSQGAGSDGPSCLTWGTPCSWNPVCYLISSSSPPSEIPQMSWKPWAQSLLSPSLPEGSSVRRSASPHMEGVCYGSSLRATGSSQQQTGTCA